MTVYNTPGDNSCGLGFSSPGVVYSCGGVVYTVPPGDDADGRSGFQIVYHPRVVYCRGVINKGGVIAVATNDMQHIQQSTTNYNDDETTPTISYPHRPPSATAQVDG